MATTHVSIPKPFSSGDAREWFLKFKICAEANGWDGNKKAKKLPTLFEGEALLVAWMVLTEDKKKYCCSKDNANQETGIIRICFVRKVSIACHFSR